MAEELGERFAFALGHRDAGALKALLAADVDFRGMTPGKTWEPSGADELVDEVLLGAWFEPTDRITEVVSVETGHVGQRRRVGYRFAVTNPDGDFLVEQQAYFDVADGQISWLRIVCSGYQPRPS
ncbi:MAG: hypothetical protein KGJ36_04465 [Acidobacteriota bacterium]|nr:hypothetical protein [Acidobacteriota bacterium]